MSQRFQEFKVGEAVKGNSINSWIEGEICIITNFVEGTVYFDCLKNGTWHRNLNVATTTVFRKLTKLEKVLK